MMTTHKNKHPTLSGQESDLVQSLLAQLAELNTPYFRSNSRSDVLQLRLGGPDIWKRWIGSTSSFRDIHRRDIESGSKALWSNR